MKFNGVYPNYIIYEYIIVVLVRENHWTGPYTIQKLAKTLTTIEYCGFGRPCLSGIIQFNVDFVDFWSSIKIGNPFDDTEYGVVYY